MPARKKSLKVGAKVSWRTSQGETTGKIVRKAEKPLKIKGFEVKASADSPAYVVRSDKSGKKAAHKAGALRAKKS